MVILVKPRNQAQPLLRQTVNGVVLVMFGKRTVSHQSTMNAVSPLRVPCICRHAQAPQSGQQHHEPNCHIKHHELLKKRQHRSSRGHLFRGGYPGYATNTHEAAHVAGVQNKSAQGCGMYLSSNWHTARDPASNAAWLNMSGRHCDIQQAQCYTLLHLVVCTDVMHQTVESESTRSFQCHGMLAGPVIM